MGGKTSTSTSQVSVPPDVLARYDSVNNQAQTAAQQPFQVYSTSPSAFVAPVNAEQTQGINQTNNFATAAQPYINAATGYTAAGGNAVDPTNLNAGSIDKYLSPYLSTVLGSTSQLLNQNNQQAMAGQLGDAISQGAFGGDREGIAAANLEQQQDLANSNIYSTIANQGYQSALSTAQQQQGVDLGAAQANRTALQQTGQSLATLGTAAQSAGLEGAQAEQAAGATQQQTTQAGDTALYNQFLQQQSYPFQVSQFLANIAEGTGALSGSTTTSTQPQSILSDERVKEDIQPIGKTFDGQNVVAFRYKGDATRRIGLIAQDVERKHPGAVSEHDGIKAVDYGKATDDAARRGHFYRGGLVPVNDDRRGYAYGGDIEALMEANGGSYGPYAMGGLYGDPGVGEPRGTKTYVPAANIPVGHLMVAQPPAPRPSLLSDASQIANLGSMLYKDAGAVGKTLGQAKDYVSDHGPMGAGSGSPEADPDLIDDAFPQNRGGFVRGFAIGGAPDDPYASPGGLDIPDDAPQGLSLAVAKPPAPDNQNGLGDLASIIAKFIPMKTGGRAGFAAGGPPDLADANMADQFRDLLQDPQAIPVDQDDDDAESPATPPTLGSPAVSAPPPKAIAQAPAGLGGNSGAPLPSGLSSTLALIAKAEGTGQNPKSSARGLYQIIDPTFVSLYRQMFPQEAQGMSKADILAIRATPQGDKLSAEMGPVLAQQNITRLKSAGLDPSAPNVYLAHFLGPDGAIRVLNADPSTPMEKLESPQAIAENGSIMKGKTAADVINWTQRRLHQVAGYATGGKVRKGYADGGDPAEDTEGEEATANAAQIPPGEMMPQPVVHDPDAQPPPAKQSWAQSLTKPEVFIPILTGLAAAASVPTVHPLMAIAEGLGAGAQAYQGQREYQLQQQQVAQHGQEVGVLQARQALEPEQIANQRIVAQAEAMKNRASLVGTALANWKSLYQPVATTGPDGMTEYKAPGGNLISATEYGREMQAYLGQVLGGTNVGNIMPPTGGANADSSVVRGSGDGGAGPGGVGAPVPAPGTAGPAHGAAAPPPGGGSVGPHVLQRPASRPLGPNASFRDKVAAGSYMTAGVPLPQVDDSRLIDADSPTYLQQGQGLMQTGNQQQAAIGQQMLEHRSRILAGQDIPQGRDGQPDMQYVQAARIKAQNDATMQGLTAMKSQTNDAATEFAEQNPANMQILQSLIRVYSESDPERSTEDWADVIGHARSIPWLANQLPDSLKNTQDLYDEAKKDSARQAIVQAVAANMASHAPAAALHQTNLTVPGPQMGAGARYNLVTQLLALQKRSSDYYSDWNQYKNSVTDIPSYSTDWNNQRPISGYERWAQDRINPFPGMTEQERAAVPRHPKAISDVASYPSGTYFVGTDGVPRRKP